MRTGGLTGRKTDIHDEAYIRFRSFASAPKIIRKNTIIIFTDRKENTDFNKQNTYYPIQEERIYLGPFQKEEQYGHYRTDVIYRVGLAAFR